MCNGYNPYRELARLTVVVGLPHNAAMFALQLLVTGIDFRLEHACVVRLGIFWAVGVGARVAQEC